MNKLKKLLLISSALLLSTANNTFAAPATASGTIAATGTVTGTCSVTATGFTFGTLSQSMATVQTSTVTPTCTNGTGWTITNNGTNEGYLYLNGTTSNTGNDRFLMPVTVTSGGAAFTLAGAATGKLTGTGNGSAQAQEGALTATAESGALKTAGSYSSTITLTITF